MGKKYFGDFVEDSTVYIPFTTNDGSGGAVAPSSAFEAADVAIFKNGSATEKTSVNGLTMTSPFNATVGLHMLAIDTSNDTGDAGFWVTSADYEVVLTPDETVDGQTVVAVIGAFSIENRFMRGTDGVDTSVMRGTDGANTTAPNTVIPDVAGTAAGLHTTTDGLIGALNNFDPTSDTVALVTAVTALTAARGEPGQATPAVNEDMLTKIDYLYKQWRNRTTNNSTNTILYNDDGTTEGQKMATSSLGGIVTVGEVVTGT